MKLVFVLASLAFLYVAVTGKPISPNQSDTITVSNQEWEDYKEKFHKNYKTIEEDKQRRENYLNNKKHVHEHNKEYEAGNVSFSLGINQFSDRGPDDKPINHGLILPSKENKNA